jgi:hypothetical protein
MSDEATKPRWVTALQPSGMVSLHLTKHNPRTGKHELAATVELTPTQAKEIGEDLIRASSMEPECQDPAKNFGA